MLVHDNRPGRYEYEQCSRASTSKSHLFDNCRTENSSIP